MENWKTSTKCESGQCVEVAITTDSIKIRNSNDHSVVASFTIDEWKAFVLGAKDGEFDI
jgi:hypothetical protein